MQSTSRLQLKSRHVVLANGRLTYFKVVGESLDSYSLRGEVPINALSSVFLEWPTGQSNNLPFLRRSESGGYANKPCQFGICGMKDNGIPYAFRLLAETSEQRDEWLNAIKVRMIFNDYIDLHVITVIIPFKSLRSTIRNREYYALEFWTSR